MAGSEPAPRLLFVMERHLGHQTYADNLRAAIEPRQDIETRWGAIDYASTSRWWERLPLDAARGTLRGRAQVASTLAGGPADVRVFNTQVPAVIGPRAARAQPYVLCTDVTPVQYDELAAGYAHRADRRGPLKWAKHRWNRRVLGQAAAHGPWSRWTAESLVADYGVDPVTIEVIPPGIDLRDWQPRSPAGRDGGDVTRLLFVGGDLARKGGATLMQAFGRLAAAGVVELHVVTRSEVPRQPGVHAHHDLTPNDERLRRLFASSDVFVLPSATETFGIAAIEAAAAGLPVVATTTGGLRDLVIDGETGMSIPPGDVDALTVALRRLVEDAELRERMGAAGRRRAEREFDARVNGNRLVDLALRTLDPATTTDDQRDGGADR